MTMNDQKEAINISTFIFKVLSGSLNGIEFSLGAQDHFICVNDEAAKQGNLSSAERTLFIPASKPGNNFILNLGSKDTENDFEITICFPEHQETLRLKYNAVHLIEGIAFAIRSDSEMWSEEVLKGVPLPVVIPQGEEESALVPVESIVKPKKTRLTASVLTCALLVVFGCFVYFAWNSKPANALLGSVFKSDSDTISKMVENRAGYSVHLGSNKIHYLFASNYQQFEWANQVVNRKNLSQTWKVVTPQSEEVRLSNILERNNVAFFTVRFTDPATPTLLLSSTRNEISTENLNFIKQLMLDAMPYAKNVYVVLEEDSEVLNRAQQGLRALGFKFETTQSESGVTLLSWMPSVDVHLSEFSRFVSQFYQTWGKRYVHFSADIREDLLKEKSFKYGEDGYITMNKSHWLFNKKMDSQ